MNVLKTTLVMVALLAAPTFTFAHEGKGHEGDMHAHMKAMDINGDGVISRDEFMKAHEAKWNEMPKDKTGGVSVADMEKMHHEMHEQHEMNEHGMKPSEPMKKDPVK